MEASERSLLLQLHVSGRNHSLAPSGLSVIFAVICIVDVFGVFPIVSLPKAIIDCGYTGILVTLAVCCTQMYTAILLGRCWLIAEDIEPSIRFKSRYPYSALADFTYGSKLSTFVTFLLDLTVFGGGVPNLIVASQNLQLLGFRLSDGYFSLSFCYWMLIIGTLICPFLWLGSPKDMKLLCSISVALVVLVFLMVFSSIVSTETENVTTQSVAEQANPYLWQSILSAYGILAFQFDIHPTVLAIQVDMKDRARISTAVVGGFVVSLGLFLLTCVSVVLRYGGRVAPSILDMLPDSATLHFASLLVALQLALSSAISNTALYQHIEDYMGISRNFNYKRCIIRSLLAILSILLAEIVPRFDLVMSLIGGALTGPLVFILPPLFYIKMLSLKKLHEENLQLECFRNIVYSAGETSRNLSKYAEISFHGELNADAVSNETDFSVTNRPFSVNLASSSQILLCNLIIMSGIFATIATTYWNVTSTIHYVTFSPPCIFSIFNVTVFTG